MKKAGVVTIAIVLLAAGVILLYRFQKNGQERIEDTGKGTLVMEDIQWKKYYM